MKKTLLALMMPLISIPMISASDAGQISLDLDNGTVSITESGFSQNGGTETACPFGNYYITKTDPSSANYLRISGGTEENPIKVTIAGLNIDMDQSSVTNNKLAPIDIRNGYVELTLCGDNTLKGGKDSPGISLPDGSTLVITAQSTGNVTANGGGTPGDGGGAGIGACAGGSAGTLIINGGEIYANGYKGGAGFGGGWEWTSDSRRAGGTLIMNAGKAVFTGSSGWSGTSCTEGVGSSNGATSVAINGGDFQATIRPSSDVTVNGQKMVPFTQKGMTPSTDYEFSNMFGPGLLTTISSDSNGNLKLWIPENGDIHSVIGDKIVVEAYAVSKYNAVKVTGGGFYNPGDIVEIAVNLQYPYIFKEWNIGGDTNPITYTVGNEDVEILPVLEIDESQLWSGEVLSEDDATCRIYYVDDRYLETSDIVVPDRLTIDGKEYTVTQFGDFEMMMFSNIYESLTIPATITSVSRYFIADFCNPKAIICKALTPPAINNGDELYTDEYMGVTLYVPARSVEAYRNDPQWGKLSKIEAIAVEPVTLDLANGSVSITERGYVQGTDAVVSHYGAYIIVNTDPEGGNNLNIDGGTEQFPIDITLDNVQINTNAESIAAECRAAIEIAGGVTRLTVAGDNTLQGSNDSPGIRVPGGATLIITEESTGILHAFGGGRNGDGGGAGIGNGCDWAAGVGTLIVNGGEIYATGTKGGAGFGSGWKWRTNSELSGGHLILNGGSIILTGSKSMNSSGSSCTDGLGSVDNPMTIEVNRGYIQSTIRGGSTVLGNGVTMTAVSQPNMTPDKVYEFNNIFGGETVAAFKANSSGMLTIWLPEGKSLRDIIGEKVIVEVSADGNPYGCKAYGGGFYAPGETIEILAYEYTPYVFKSWDFGSTENPATITAASEDMNIKAIFEVDERQLWRGHVYSEEEGTCYIMSYDGFQSKATDIEVPETLTINGKEYTVISIGEPDRDMLMMMVGHEINSITIPGSIQYISQRVFGELMGLNCVICNAANPPEVIRDGNFYGIENLTLQVPAEYMEAYRMDGKWGKLGSFNGVGDLPANFTAAMHSDTQKIIPGITFNLYYELSDDALAAEFHPGPTHPEIGVMTLDVENVPAGSVEWSSDNGNVATVDENGIVTSHNIGSATITATIRSPHYEMPLIASSDVTVEQLTSIDGIEAGTDTTVIVYNISGNKIYEGTAALLPELPAGIYVIRYANGTTKKLQLK